MVSGKKILVCGVSGRVGAALAYVLAKHNDVYGICRSASSEKAAWAASAGVSIIEMDVGRDPLTTLPTDFDVVFNQVVAWGPDWHVAKRINVDFTADLIWHFRDNPCTMVLGSTGGVHGPIDINDPWAEESMPLMGFGVYGQTKTQMEVTAQWVCRKANVPTVILRYYWPAAPYDLASPVARVIKTMEAGEPVVCHEQYPRLRQLCHISDVVRWSLAALPFATVPADAFCVGHPKPASDADIARVATDVLDKPLTLQAGGDPAPKNSLGTMARMLKELGEPRHDMASVVGMTRRALHENVSGPADWMFDSDLLEGKG